MPPAVDATNHTAAPPTTNPTINFDHQVEPSPRRRLIKVVAYQYG